MRSPHLPDLPSINSFVPEEGCMHGRETEFPLLHLEKGARIRDGNRRESVFDTGDGGTSDSAED